MGEMTAREDTGANPCLFTSPAKTHDLGLCQPGVDDVPKSLSVVGKCQDVDSERCIYASVFPFECQLTQCTVDLSMPVQNPCCLHLWGCSLPLPSPGCQHCILSRLITDGWPDENADIPGHGNFSFTSMRILYQWQFLAMHLHQHQISPSIASRVLAGGVGQVNSGRDYIRDCSRNDMTLCFSHFCAVLIMGTGSGNISLVAEGLGRAILPTSMLQVWQPKVAE